MKEFLGKLSLLVIAFLAPIWTAMIATIVLIGIDTVFGILAAKKQKIKISSRKFSMVLIKLLVYNLLIIASFITESYLFAGLPIVKLTLMFIGLTEFLSIGESFSIITGKSFIKYIKEFITSKIKRPIDNINK